MFKPNVNNGLLTSRFDEIKTHLNHQLSFSPYSNQGHILVNNKHYTFEVDEDGHLYSPAKLDGYDYYKGKSYLGHYNDMTFSPVDDNRKSVTELFNDNKIGSKLLVNDPRTAGQLSKLERLGEMKYIIETLINGEYYYTDTNPLSGFGGNRMYEPMDEIFEQYPNIERRYHNDYSVTSEYRGEYYELRELIEQQLSKQGKLDKRRADYTGLSSEMSAAELAPETRMAEMEWIISSNPEDLQYHLSFFPSFAERYNEYATTYKDEFREVIKSRKPELIRTEQFSPFFFSPNNDQRTAAQLSRNERLAEMRFILFHPSDAQVKAETDDYFYRRHEDYLKEEYNDDFDMIQQQVKKQLIRPEINDQRTAAQLSRDERLAEMRYILFHPSDAQVRGETDIYFYRRNEEYLKKYNDEFDMIQQQVQQEIKMGATSHLRRKR